MKRALFLVLFLILSSGALAETAVTPDGLRASYARALIDIGQRETGSSGEYTVDCGDTVVLNTPDVLADVQGIDTVGEAAWEPIVCVLTLSATKKAVMFAFDNSRPDDVLIEHFAEYTPSVITLSDLAPTACEGENVQPGAGEVFAECITLGGKRAIDKPGYHLYIKRESNTGSDAVPVNTYLFTYGFAPYNQGLFAEILNFFKTLFGAGTSVTGDQHLSAFRKGYFVEIGTGDLKRIVQAFYYTDQSSEATDAATVVFNGFMEDFSGLAGEGDTYEIGYHVQAITFSHMTPSRWQRLITAARITPKSGTAIGDVANLCGNGVLNVGEDCDTGGSAPMRKTRCDQIGYTYGTLACKNDCTYDATGCVACADADGDHYPTFEGVPVELAKLRGGTRVGSIAIDTNYDPSAGASYTNDRAKRTELGMAAQAVPLPLDYFYGGTSFGAVQTQVNTLIATLVPQFQACKGGDDQLDPVAEETGNAADLLATYVAVKMLDPVTGTPCTLSETRSWQCSAGVGPAAFGQFPDYATLLSALGTERIAPIFVIEPGSHKTVSTDTEKLKLSFLCAGLARGAQQRWTPGTPPLPLDTYIYGLDPWLLDRDAGIAADDAAADAYLTSYSFCRAGIELLLTASSKLYYSPGPVGSALFERLTDASVGSAPTRIVDGIVLSEPSAYVRGDLATTRDAQPLPVNELVSQIGAEVIIFPVDIEAQVATDLPALANPLIDAARANARAALFVGTKAPLSRAPLLSAENALTVPGNFLKEILPLFVQGLYKPSSINGADAQVLVARPTTGPSNTIIYNNPAELQAPEFLNFDDCSLTIRKPGTTGTLGTVSSPWSAVRNTAGPYFVSLDDWECYLGSGILGSCTIKGIEQNNELDCDDTKATINPGAQEVCASAGTAAVDEDCDGFADDQDLGGCTPPTVTAGCDADTICESGESPATCADCFFKQGCPTEQEQILKFGTAANGYTAKFWFNTAGKPQVFFSKSGTCPLVSSVVTWKDLPDGSGTATRVAGDGANTDLSLVQTTGGWEIKYKNKNNDATFSSCWKSCVITTAPRTTATACKNIAPGGQFSPTTIATLAIDDYETCGVCPNILNILWAPAPIEGRGAAYTQGVYTFESAKSQSGVPLLRISAECANIPNPPGGSYADSSYCEIGPLDACEDNDALEAALIIEGSTTPKTTDVYEKLVSGACKDPTTSTTLGLCAQSTAAADGWTITFKDDGLAAAKPGRTCWTSEYSTSLNAQTINIPYPQTDCLSACRTPCDSNAYCGTEERCVAGCCEWIPPRLCFTPDTPVLTPAGERPIGELRLGDLVTSYDPERQQFVTSPVTYIEKNRGDEVLVLNGRVRTTDVHLFFTKRGWVAAGLLVDGDEIFTQEGAWERVSSLRHEQYDGPLYNIHVGADAHDFFADGLLVHNRKACDDEGVPCPLRQLPLQ